jgi:hypothetical protein
MKKTSSIIGMIIIVFWAVMVGLLFKRNSFDASEITLTRGYLTENIEEKEEWAGIYFKDDKVGYSHATLNRSEKGYHITEETVLDMSIMGVPQKVNTVLKAETGSDFSLSIFNLIVQSGMITFKAYGEIEDNTLHVTIDSGGELQHKSIKLSEPPSLANSLKYYLLQSGLAPGKKFTRKFFDPLTLTNRPIAVEVEGKEEISLKGKKYTCFRIKESFKGITVYAWINDQGETLKEESPMGLVLIKESEYDATSVNWSGKKVDLLAATAIPLDHPIIKEDLVYLRLRLKNVPLDGYTLHGGRQDFDQDTVAVRLERVNRTDSYTIPYEGKEFKRFLVPTTLIQSNNKDISSQTNKILGPEKEAQTVVNKLKEWVFSNIQKKPTLNLPSALEVLRTKTGDCNEHAVLFTALARSAGIPTRMCAGIVYAKGSFYYHAWVEVFLNRWISLDPTMNQFPADVTHIKFIEGDLESQLTLLRIVGKLGIEVLEYS